MEIFAIKFNKTEEPINETEFWKNSCKDLEEQLEYVNLQYQELSQNMEKVLGVKDLVYNETLKKYEFL